MLAFQHEQIGSFARKTYTVSSMPVYCCSNLSYWLPNISGTCRQTFGGYWLLDHTMSREVAVGVAFHMWTKKHNFFYESTIFQQYLTCIHTDTT